MFQDTQLSRPPFPRQRGGFLAPWYRCHQIAGDLVMSRTATSAAVTVLKSTPVLQSVCRFGHQHLRHGARARDASRCPGFWPRRNNRTSSALLPHSAPNT